jgi:predicted DNA-binding transcriptional regulator AlpA
MNSDGWLCVARYLTVRELCALMQVSRDWFYLWVTDRMHRILSKFPALQACE